MSFGKSTESYIGHQLVNKGELIFTPRDFDATPILSGISNFDGCISNLYFVLVANKLKTTEKYINWYWWGIKYGFNYFKEFSYGIRFSFNQEQFSNIPFLYTSLLEQQKIANFLDIKTAQFDSIIEKKELLIKKLEEAKKSLISEVVTGKVKIVDGKLVKRDISEMKDSGVFKLIPNNWRKTRLKFISSINARIGWKGLKAEEYVEDGYVLLSTPNIKERNIDFKNVNYINKNRFMESPEIKLKEGDVLLTKDGTLGTVNVIRKLEKNGTINSSIALLCMFDEVNPILIYYFLLSSELQNRINEMKEGIGVPHLFQKDIKEFEILIPSAIESEKIVKFLDYETLVIEKMIINIKSQIKKLNQAKQSLISEAVTGKIDLRGWEIIEEGELS